MQLSSLLTLLSLVRRHRNVRPDPEFFAWSVRLVDVHQRAGNVEESLLADLVNELVPLLPEKERAKLTRIIMARRSTEAEPQKVLAPQLEQGQPAQPAPRLLQRSEEASVQVKLAPAVHPHEADFGLRVEPVRPLSVSAKSANIGAMAGGRLWALLAKAAEQAEPAASPAASPAETSTAASTVLHSAEVEEVPSSLGVDACLQTALFSFAARNRTRNGHVDSKSPGSDECRLTKYDRLQQVHAVVFCASRLE